MNKLLCGVSLCILLTFCCTIPVKSTHKETLACFRGNAHLLYQSNWHMMKDIFITQPEQMVSRWLGVRGALIALATGAGVGTYFGIDKGIRYLNDTSKPAIRPNAVYRGRIEVPWPFLENKKNLLAGSGGLVTAVTLYKSLTYWFLEWEEIKQLERLLMQWPDIQELCPKELHTPFTALVSLKRSQSPDYHVQLRETVRLVKAAIHARFPEEYASVNQSYFDYSRVNFNLHLDILYLADKIYRFFIG